MSRYNPQQSDSWNNQYADEEEFDYVPKPSRDFLNHRQLVLYANKREDLIDWLSDEAASNGDGCLSEQCQSNYASRIDQIYRWVWQNEGVVMEIGTDYAEAFVKALDKDHFQTRNGNAYSDDSKRKFVNALKKLLQWEIDEDLDWEPDENFSQSEYNSVDPLTRSERQKLREAASEYGSLPCYSDLSPEERSRKKGLLAQRIDKPKKEISLDDWKQQNRTWKFASLVMTALDVGFRPCEVERARTTWFQPDSESLKISKEDSAKSDAEWTVALRSSTATAIEHWLDERKSDPTYDDTDKLWLNRNGNPYNSKTLNHLFRKLLDEAGIDSQNRRLTWYSIRHSVGTYMTEKGSVEEARAQLRHKSSETTRRYVHPTLESRKDTLNDI